MDFLIFLRLLKAPILCTHDADGVYVHLSSTSYFVAMLSSSLFTSFSSEAERWIGAEGATLVNFMYTRGIISRLFFLASSR